MYNRQDMETAQVSINGWTDKKAVAYIYNRVLFSHKKKWSLAICNHMDEPGQY